ncbi:UNVERIFIED_CONTAM: hypothetical protein Sangu_3146000 [Sesamum angustifolium]|uniref:Secreted protein n=1 Tax=Sesamum angustifolium TaxID=2727405 RepID=A0AAW2JZJ8_9LAMI
MVAYQTLIVPLVSFLLFIIFLHKRRSNAAPQPRKRLPAVSKKASHNRNLHQLGVLPPPVFSRPYPGVTASSCYFTCGQVPDLCLLGCTACES